MPGWAHRYPSYRRMFRIPKKSFGLKFGSHNERWDSNLFFVFSTVIHVPKLPCTRYTIFRPGPGIPGTIETGSPGSGIIRTHTSLVDQSTLIKPLNRYVSKTYPGRKWGRRGLRVFNRDPQFSQNLLPVSIVSLFPMSDYLIPGGMLYLFFCMRCRERTWWKVAGYSMNLKVLRLNETFYGTFEKGKPR